MKNARRWITPLTLLAALAAGAVWLALADAALANDPLLSITHFLETTR
jgi:hypothetical protein